MFRFFRAAFKEHTFVSEFYRMSSSRCFSSSFGDSPGRSLITSSPKLALICLSCYPLGLANADCSAPSSTFIVPWGSLMTKHALLCTPLLWLSIELPVRSVSSIQASVFVCWSTCYTLKYADCFTVGASSLCSFGFAPLPPCIRLLT